MFISYQQVTKWHQSLFILQVRPHVEGDLLRLWSDTKTWQAHTKNKEEFINIQQPLYQVNTFTAKQVNSCIVASQTGECCTLL